MDGSGADRDWSGETIPQMYGVSAGGNQIYRTLDDKKGLEVGHNQETN